MDPRMRSVMETQSTSEENAVMAQTEQKPDLVSEAVQADHQEQTAKQTTPPPPAPEEKPVEIWCPRCDAAHQLNIFQPGVPLAAGGMGLLLLGRCDACGLVLWPIGVLPIQQMPQGRIAVPQGFHGPQRRH